MMCITTFPALAEAITIPVGKLTAATIAAAGLADADYTVIEPAGEGVRVRTAGVDEALEYEQAHGLGRVTDSLEEFFAQLESDE
jgi:hypothetical protein